MDDTIGRAVISGLFQMFLVAYATGAVWILVPLYLITALTGSLRYGTAAYILGVLGLFVWMTNSSEALSTGSLWSRIPNLPILVAAYLPGYFPLLILKPLVGSTIRGIPIWRILMVVLALAVVGIYFYTTSQIDLSPYR